MSDFKENLVNLAERFYAVESTVDLLTGKVFFHLQGRLCKNKDLLLLHTFIKDEDGDFRYSDKDIRIFLVGRSDELLQ